jgi:GT2 family glycosyltransferase
VSLADGTSASSVTVVIVTFNAGNTLERCLEAVRAQSLSPARVIIVDNASKDGSIERAKALFPAFEYLQMGTNTGFAAANNHAIRRCDTEFVALLNPDAFPDRNWLEELVSAAQRTPEAASFGSCQFIEGRPGVLDGIADICHVSGLVWREGHGRPSDGREQTGREIFSPCAAAALYRRSAVETAGGFDETFFCYVEDVDLGFRLRLNGWQARYVPTARVRHVGSASSGSAHSDFAVYHGHRNLVWLYVKNMPGYLFWLFLPLHLCMNIVAVIVLAFRGQAAVALRSKRDAIAGLPAAWRKRRAIQAGRKIRSSTLLRMLDRRMLPTSMR